MGFGVDLDYQTADFGPNGSGLWPGQSSANGFAPYGDVMSEGSSRLRALSWVLSAVTFVAGFVIGMTIHANLGAFLWICSAVFALLPFWSHRNRV